MQQKCLNLEKFIASALLFSFFSCSSFSDSPQSSHISSTTGAKTWEIHNEGVHFSLTQLLPEQLRAFYVNRGFSLTQIESYASSCVYMTVLRNDNAPGVIHYISNNWKVVFENNSHEMMSIDQWIKRLSAMGVKKSAMIAFRWAQFPAEQEYRPGGDWNQGMLSVGLPPGSQFDISANWNIGEKEYEATLTEVLCAE